MRSSVVDSISEISSQLNQLSEKVNDPSTSCSKRCSVYVSTMNWDSTVADKPLPNWFNYEESGHY